MKILRPLALLVLLAPAACAGPQAEEIASSEQGVSLVGRWARVRDGVVRQGVDFSGAEVLVKRQAGSRLTVDWAARALEATVDLCDVAAVHDGARWVPNACAEEVPAGAPPPGPIGSLAAGGIGVHTRISAERCDGEQDNGPRNIAAVLAVAANLAPGKRMLVVDYTKAAADGPWGLVTNHKQCLERFVGAIAAAGKLDALTLVLRVDAPNQGGNVDTTPDEAGASARAAYVASVGKVVGALRATAPGLRFGIVLGNEPDLVENRPRNEDHQARDAAFTLDEWAPAAGPTLKAIARAHPDITFVAPALSANMKTSVVPYYQRLLGRDRPANLVPAIHAYSLDAQAAGAAAGWARQITAAGLGPVVGTELGPFDGNPGGSVDAMRALRASGAMHAAVAWILLSRDHDGRGQDNAWGFRVGTSPEDPAARAVADAINAAP